MDDIEDDIVLEAIHLIKTMDQCGLIAGDTSSVEQLVFDPSNDLRMMKMNSIWSIKARI